MTTLCRQLADAMLTVKDEEGKQVFPQSRVIRLIQDKGIQKQFFKENDIPTAPFQLVNTKEEMLNSTFDYPYILKQRRDGYDGKGVMKISSAKDVDYAFDSPSLIEELVDFDKEINHNNKIYNQNVNNSKKQKQLSDCHCNRNIYVDRSNRIPTKKSGKSN